MVEGGMKCVKLLIFSFNLLFVLVGIALIACGAYVQIQLKKYFQLIDGSFDSAAVLLIVVGVIVFMIAFFGCIGAIRENHTCVMIYAVLLGLIFILEIAGGIAGFVLKDKVRDSVEKLMNTSLQKEIDQPVSPNIWDDIQKEFKCCGVETYKDWEKSGINKTAPDSCCTVHGCDRRNSSLLYTEGCLHKFTGWVQDRIVIVGGIGIAFAFIQVVGILCACCLARAIKKEYEVV
ncbi:hypothetical protein CHS0354_014829 [Potamilus streckersoni]|uniref:Tetraspanin n=1 Tax=Potamilus streckersoni TaxID=2493646 RepID=A0AAE0RVM3_9BIVA|nr:hypothetical protein CHS0354_014829 [Potamilus streckersoni]